MKLFFWIIAGVGCLSVGVFASLLVAFGIKCLRDHLRAKNGPVRHDHDCLVRGCDFHEDAEVDEKMDKWLSQNKKRDIVIRDHDLKMGALNLIIAEIRARRPLAGEDSASQEP